eukprot:scaffold1377_cov231-Chaetoceros_neogracile.AAC.10
MMSLVDVLCKAHNLQSKRKRSFRGAKIRLSQSPVNSCFWVIWHESWGHACLKCQVYCSIEACE